MAENPGMIVVDSTVWIDYFNGKKTKNTVLLERFLVGETDILLFPVIQMEVLSGFRAEQDFEKTRQIFSNIPTVALSKDTHINAARLYRRLRQKGVTVRKLFDCLIAQACIETGAQLLTSDKDFKYIALHSQLKLIH
jgi:predicted nucleic acid-binding protein